MQDLGRGPFFFIIITNITTTQITSITNTVLLYTNTSSLLHLKQFYFNTITKLNYFFFENSLRVVIPRQCLYIYTIGFVPISDKKNTFPNLFKDLKDKIKDIFPIMYIY